MAGTVNISRDLFTDEAFRDEPFTEREAWVWLIMAASWKSRSVRSGDYVVNTKRGQLAHSIRYMATAWKWSKSKVDRYLKRLEKLNLIRFESGTGVNLITVCKYEDYQSKANASGTGAGQERDRSGTEKNKGEIRMKEGNSIDAVASRKKASRLPDDWHLPKQYGEWALAEGWPENVIRLEADKFRDYWVSKSGKDAAKLDWLATWRNWMRNSKNPRVINGEQNGKHEVTSGTDRFRRVIEAAARGTSGKDWG